MDDKDYKDVNTNIANNHDKNQTKSAQQMFVDRLIDENAALNEQVQALSSLLQKYNFSLQDLENEKEKIMEQWRQYKEKYDKAIAATKNEKQKYKEAKEAYYRCKENYKTEIDDLFKIIKRQF